MSTATMSPNFQRGTASTRQATERQIAFLTELVTQIGGFDRERGLVLWGEMREAQQAGLLTFTNASVHIDLFKTERDKLRAEAKPAPVERPKRELPEVPAGRYAVTKVDGETGFYRVHISDTGFVTVSVMASSTEHKLPFVVARSVLKKIESDGVRIALERFGRELGRCGVCGRTLTDEASRAAGIGPICASRM